MGIKQFSKAFTAGRIVKWSDLQGKRIAVDAMTEIYRASLGARRLNLLTDHMGRPTLYINVIIANLIQMEKNNIKQIWVFDHDASNGEYNPIKVMELTKRREQKRKVKEKIQKARESLAAVNNALTEEEMLFSDDDSDDDDGDDDGNNNVDSVQNTIDRLTKQTYTVSNREIADIKFILNCLGISWVDAPKAYEGEHIAAYLSKIGVVDGVYSSDTDPIPFGATTLWRKNLRDKKIYEYNLNDILQSHDLTIKELRKVCVILGCDFAPKTKRIGPKTVFKKLHNTLLTTEQQAAIGEFSKTDDAELDITIHNEDIVAFSNKELFDKLIQWLVIEKDFSRSRMLKRFKNIIKN